MPGRGNGRHAASYAPLVDLDPQIADAVLTILADEAIAAYAVPVSDHRTLSDLPGRIIDRPLDRVYVDSVESARARRIVDDTLPGIVSELESAHIDDRSAEQAAGSRDADDEAAWADIVAGYDSDTSDPVPRWPVAEDLSPEDERRRGRLLRAASFDDVGDGETRDEPARPVPPVSATARADADDHFVPPHPPPLQLPTDPVSRAAWIGLIGGPLLIIGAALFGWTLQGWVGLLAVGGFVGGFVTLVARMRDRPPPESGDDGAVV